MKSFVPLTNDLAFKVFFKSEQNRPLLTALLNNFLPLPANTKIVEVSISDSELLPETISGLPASKRGLLDIKATCIQRLPSGGKRSEIVNVEMQTSSQPHLSERLAFYACKLYAGQLEAGDGFDRLKNVYSLTFTTFNMPQFAKSPRYYHYCDLRDREPPYANFTYALNFIVVELSKFYRPLEELVDLREEWCYFLKESGRMNKRDGEFLASQGEIMSKAVKSLWNLSQDEIMQEIWEAEEKQRRDRRAQEKYALEMATQKGLEEGMEKGMEKGMERGMEKGMEKGMERGMEKGLRRGREQGREEIARGLLATGADPEFVARITKLPLKEIEKLKNS